MQKQCNKNRRCIHGFIKKNILHNLNKTKYGCMVVKIWNGYWVLRNYVSTGDRRR